MAKMILAFLLLTVTFGSLILARKESDNKSRIRVMKYLAFTSFCASAAFVVLVLVAIFF